MSTISSQKIPLKYTCETCDYATCNKKDYRKHLLTDKHKNLNISTDFNKKSQEIPNHSVCECGKIYKDRSGLWRHKKKCIKTQNINEDDENENKKHNKNQELQQTQPPQQNQARMTAELEEQRRLFLEQHQQRMLEQRMLEQNRQRLLEQQRQLNEQQHVKTDDKKKEEKKNDKVVNSEKSDDKKKSKKVSEKEVSSSSSSDESAHGQKG